MGKLATSPPNTGAKACPVVSGVRGDKSDVAAVRAAMNDPRVGHVHVSKWLRDVGGINVSEATIRRHRDNKCPECVGVSNG